MTTRRIELDTDPREPASNRPRRRGAWRYFLAGELPFSAVVIFCGGAFIAGQQSVGPRDKVAIAEKGAIVLESVLAHPEASKDEIETRLRRPILAVFKKYADRGYTVLDASKDEAGNLAVVAIPAGALDITSELRQAVLYASGQLAPSLAATPGLPPSPNVRAANSTPPASGAAR